MAEKHQHDRSEARRLALQVLYQAEILETDPATIIEEGRLVDETQLWGNYARRLIEGATADQEAIDAELVEASENWALDRMPVVDRSLLRMAAYEMRSVDEVPISVSINEAVNLAKEFGGEDSPRFVNGILGRIASVKKYKPDAVPGEYIDEIVDAVADDDLPLDDALKLYEEAVQLGLRASSLLEENLQENNALYDEERSEDVQDAGEETPNASEPDASVEPALESN